MRDTSVNKTAIKNFAIAARKKLISEITYKAGLVGITKEGIAEPVHKSDGLEMYDIGTNEPYTIKGDEINERKSLVARVIEKGFDQVIEEVAYTWFNRIVAVRFMEINDYLPARIRVLSSEMKGKAEPDIVTVAPNVDLGFKPDEIDEILQLKHDNKLDELFRMLFIKQCNALNEILPELFEKTADYTELLLGISFTNEDSIIRELVNSIDEDDFKEQVEIIGWLYQYYITEINELVYDGSFKKSRIPKELLPAATQIFTPDWVVKYMVENSIGRLALESLPVGEDIINEWKYFIKNGQTNKEKPHNLEKIKIMDPSMGSGHILVYAFDVLMDIYKSCGYAEREATKLILENNLYGFDIDDRAYQLAYFAVMMKARGYSRRILGEGIKPQLCSIQESNIISSELIDFVAAEDREIKADLIYLVEIFKDAKEYGSILNARVVDYRRIYIRMNEIEKGFTDDLFGLMHKEQMINKLAPIIKQAELMAQTYDVVITNPPYLNSSRMSEKLLQYVNENYPDTKADFSMIFYQKAMNDYCKENGFISFITTASWMFLTSFRKIRKKVIEELEFESLVDFGTELFDGKVGHNLIVAWVNKKCRPTKNMDAIRLTEYCYSKKGEKEEQFFNIKNRHTANQKDFSKIPGVPITYWLNKKIYKLFEQNDKISDYAIINEGLKTRNNDYFLRFWYEVSDKKWKFYAKGGGFRKWYGNNEYVARWGINGQEIREFKKSSGSNFKYYFKKTITYSAISNSKFSVRYINNCLFGGGGSGITNVDDDKFNYIFGFLNSKVCNKIIEISPTLNFEVGQVSSLPIVFDDSLKSHINDIVERNIFISKIDWDSFESSFEFDKHPFIKLKVESGKLKIEELFTTWQAFTKKQFNKVKANEEELNRIFIEIYGLDDLTSEIDDKDVTIRKADLQRDITSFLSYAIGCMFGRYSLDIDGLAHVSGDLDNTKYQTFIPDINNIIPIADEEYFVDDIVGRFVEFIKINFGSEMLEVNLDFIAQALGSKGNTSREIIRNYFINDFYKDHVRIYKNKPIYWLFDSGKENGFKALVYMHRYNQDTVGRVRADYLHRTQKAIENSISRADMIMDSVANPTQKAKAVKDKEKFVKQLAETRLYDAAIGHIAAQRIAIDLDDGVTVNYAKFQGVEVSSEGKKTSKIDLLGKI